MRTLEDVIDFSNYPKDHELYSNARAKELGYLKNEYPDKTILSFVGLKSKTYGLMVSGGSFFLKAKGVPSRTKRAIPFSAMEECLVNLSTHTVNFNAIRCRNHVNQLVNSDRVAFSSFDDKRYLLCPLHSLPYGSIHIPKNHVKSVTTAGRKCCPICDPRMNTYNESTSSESEETEHDGDYYDEIYSTDDSGNI